MACGPLDTVRRLALARGRWPYLQPHVSWLAAVLLFFNSAVIQTWQVIMVLEIDADGVGSSGLTGEAQLTPSAELPSAEARLVRPRLSPGYEDPIYFSSLDSCPCGCCDKRPQTVT